MKAQRIAESMASEHARRHGISKSSGSYSQLVSGFLPTATGIAEGLTPFEKAVKKVLKTQRKRLEIQKQRWESHDNPASTFVDYTPNDTLVKQQSEKLIKRSMNGHYPKPEIPDSIPPDWS